MRKQIADGELAGRIGVGEPEGRIEVGDLGIPGHDVIADQRGHDRCGDGLGKGSDLDPAWSADGNRIFYDRWFDGPRGVFSVAPLGGDEQLVLEDAMFPEPLPDGSLLLVRINPEHRQQLFRYWPDSGKLQGYAVEPTAGLSGPRSVRDGRLALVLDLAGLAGEGGPWQLATRVSPSPEAVV